METSHPIRPLFPRLQMPTTPLCRMLSGRSQIPGPHLQHSFRNSSTLNGVPQGSIVSPVIFLTSKSTTLWNQPNDVTALYLWTTLQSMWQVDCTQKFSTDSSCALIRYPMGWRKQFYLDLLHLKTVLSIPTIRLGKETIPKVKEAKYLGVIFDQKLSFLSPIKQLKTLCQKP